MTLITRNRAFAHLRIDFKKKRHKTYTFRII